MSVNLLREFLDQPLEFQETTRAILLKESKKKTKAKMKADGFFEESCRLCRKKWTEKGFKTCGDCGRARYCSSECQTADLPNHKAVCTQVPALFTSLHPVLNQNVIYQTVLRFAFIHHFQLTKKRLPKYSKGYDASDGRPPAPPLMVLNVDLVLESPSTGNSGTRGIEPDEVVVVPQLRNLHFPPPLAMTYDQYNVRRRVLIAGVQVAEAEKPRRMDESPDYVAFAGLLVVHFQSKVSEPLAHPFVIFQSTLDEYALGQSASTLCMITTGSTPDSYSPEDAQRFINRVIRDDVKDYFCLQRKVSTVRYQELNSAKEAENAQRLTAMRAEKQKSDIENGMQLFTAGWTQKVFSNED